MKYEFPEDADTILNMGPNDTFVISYANQGMRIEKQMNTYEIYEWLPERPVEHTLSFLESEIDLVIAEVASWRKF